MALFIFTLLPSHVYSVDFQQIYDVRYCNKLNAESDKRMQLLSIKPDIKEIFENVKTKLFSVKIFLIWKIEIFHKNTLFIYSCNGYY